MFFLRTPIQLNLVCHSTKQPAVHVERAYRLLRLVDCSDRRLLLFDDLEVLCRASVANWGARSGLSPMLRGGSRPPGTEVAISLIA